MHITIRKIAPTNIHLRKAKIAFAVTRCHHKPEVRMLDGNYCAGWVLAVQWEVDTSFSTVPLLELTLGKIASIMCSIYADRLACGTMDLIIDTFFGFDICWRISRSNSKISFSIQFTGAVIAKPSSPLGTNSLMNLLVMNQNSLLM